MIAFEVAIRQPALRSERKAGNQITKHKGSVMPLDPQLQPILDSMAPMAAIDWGTMPPNAAREMMGAMPLPYQVDLPEVRDITVAGDGAQLAARLYRPSAEEGLPVVVFFHGGGWVTGTLESHDLLCRLIARESGCAVVSVDYRLAPEHAFPVPLEDCYAAVQWVAANAAALGVDASRLAVAGDSAGGNLAAAVALLTRDRGGATISHQLLLYPVADADFANGSYTENGQGYFLSKDMMRWFWGHYVGADALASGNVPPLAALCRVENLAGLPSASIVTAEYDPLRDEGEVLARRLADAGAAVELTRVPGVIHGFASMLGIADIAEKTVRDASRRLAESLGAGAKIMAGA